jgi:hypothetical protein
VRGNQLYKSLFFITRFPGQKVKCALDASKVNSEGSYCATAALVVSIGTSAPKDNQLQRATREGADWTDTQTTPSLHFIMSHLHNQWTMQMHVLMSSVDVF